MAQLAAVFGQPRDRSFELMTAAWLQALGHLTPSQLQTAVARVVQSCKFWPTPAELLAVLKVEREQTGGQPLYRAEPVMFRDPAARARVKTLVEKFKLKLGPEPTTDFETSKPASQDMSVSDALRNSRAARRALAGREVTEAA